MIPLKPFVLAMCCRVLGTQCFAAAKPPNIVVLAGLLVWRQRRKKRAE